MLMCIYSVLFKILLHANMHLFCAISGLIHANVHLFGAILGFTHVNISTANLTPNGEKIRRFEYSTPFPRRVEFHAFIRCFENNSKIHRKDRYKRL